MGTTPLAVPGLENRTPLTDQVTGLPVITDAETFFAYLAHGAVTDLDGPLLDEIVHTAADGPLRRYNADGTDRRVTDDDWFTATLTLRGLNEDHLRELCAGICQGPNHDLRVISRRLLDHPACTDPVAVQLLRDASYRRDASGVSTSGASVLMVLDERRHPAAVAYRLSHAAGVTWEPGLDQDAVVRRLRDLGVDAARVVDRMAGDWNGKLGDLLEAAAAVALPARTAQHPGART